MSLTGYILVLAHAVPIVLIGMITRSKLAVWISAAAMALVAIFVGHPGYTALDMMAVILACGGCISYFNEERKNAEMESLLKSTDTDRRENSRDDGRRSE